MQAGSSPEEKGGTSSGDKQTHVLFYCITLDIVYMIRNGTRQVHPRSECQQCHPALVAPHSDLYERSDNP